MTFLLCLALMTFFGASPSASAASAVAGGVAGLAGSAAGATTGFFGSSGLGASFAILFLRSLGFFRALHAHGLARAFAGARVGGRALAADRQSLLVPDALVTIDAHLAFDVRLNLAAQVAFDPVALQRGVQMRELFVVQILRPDIGIDLRLCADL